MTKKEFLERFTNKKTGKLELPKGFILGEPINTNEIGVYSFRNWWMVDKIGIPNPMSIGDALTPVHLYMGLNENKAFDVFTDFVTGAENADSWIIHHKHASDDPDESTNLLSQIGPSNVNFDADSIDKAQIIESIINNNLKSYNLNLDIVSKKTNTTFYFGQYKSDINAYTIFKLNNEWYTCSTDEKLNHLIEGPYSNAEIIYIWSLDNNLNDLFEKYDFFRNHVNPYANIQRFNSFKEFSEYSKK